MNVTSNAKQLAARLAARIQALQPNSPELRKAFSQIGAVISAQAQINVRSLGLIDTGRLLNSLRWEYLDNGKTGIRVGSFGVPYAAVHEFGFRGMVTVRAHQRVTSMAFGRPIPTVSVPVAAHSRRVNIRKRPYLAPAIKKHSVYAADLIRAALSGAAS